MKTYKYHIKPNQTDISWEVTHTPTYNQLIVSWNSLRPTVGFYLIEVALFLKGCWSDWITYAQWGTNFQECYEHEGNGYKVHQDVVQSSECNGFRVRVSAKENASLIHFHTLFACIGDVNKHFFDSSLFGATTTELDVLGRSQMAIIDPKNKRVCSPASTTAVLQYLKPSSELGIMHFAGKVWDQNCDVFGNWVLNIAEAYNYLGADWSCWVECLTSFNLVLDQLKKGYPIIVSIKGPLEGAPLSYSSGHLVAVIGYNHNTSQILCIDPAFPTDNFTKVYYPYYDFLQAWSRRHYLAYMFNFSNDEKGVLTEGS